MITKKNSHQPITATRCSIVNVTSTFGIISSMNFCPPNPGSTVITKAMSIWLAHGAKYSTVVPGLIAKPTYRRESQVIIAKTT